MILFALASGIRYSYCHTLTHIHVLVHTVGAWGGWRGRTGQGDVGALGDALSGVGPGVAVLFIHNYYIQVPTGT